MAIKINKNSKEKVYKYIPIAEREDKNPFTVTIRPLTSRELALLEDKLIKVNRDESLAFNSGSFNWEVCKRGIEGWENITDEKGKPIIIKREGSGLISDDSLNYIPLDILNEIANVVLNISKDPENASIYLGEDSNQ